MDANPYEVLESSFTYKARGSSTMQGKIKNLKTGSIITRTFHTGDNFQEAEIQKMRVKFIYENRGTCTFSQINDPGKRFELSKEQIGEQSVFLLPNTEVEGLALEDEVINIVVPIKMSFKIKDAPPGIKGDRSVGGTKGATLETGVVVQVPLFVETGDVIEINTETSEYTRRVEKKGE